MFKLFLLKRKKNAILYEGQTVHVIIEIAYLVAELSTFPSCYDNHNIPKISYSSIACGLLLSSTVNS